MQKALMSVVLVLASCMPHAIATTYLEGDPETELMLSRCFGNYECDFQALIDSTQCAGLKKVCSFSYFTRVPSCSDCNPIVSHDLYSNQEGEYCRLTAFSEIQKHVIAGRFIVRIQNKESTYQAFRLEFANGELEAMQNLKEHLVSKMG